MNRFLEVNGGQRTETTLKAPILGQKKRAGDGNRRSEESPKYSKKGGLGDHHYTTDAAERDNLVNMGWQYEGIAWYGL